MTLPAPSLQQSAARVLIAVRNLLRDESVFEPYRDAQVAGLAADGVTVTLPAPIYVEVGTWAAWQATGVSAPGLLIFEAEPSTFEPDVAGDTYQVESTIGVGVLLTEQDVSATDPGGVYLASIAYATAVANCIQRHISALGFGGAVGVYNAVIFRCAAELAPVEIEGGNYRLSDTAHRVYWQTLQEPPETP